MAQYVEKNDISLDTFTHRRAYGSQQGCDFGCVGWLEKPVTMMSWCLGQTAFGRLQLQKSDGTSIIVGATDLPDKITWNFMEGERFTEIKMYTASSKLVGVCITTSRNTYRAVVKDFDRLSPQMTNIDVGSGACVGVFGNSGVWLESLGFAMLKEEMLSGLSVAAKYGKSKGKHSTRSSSRK